MKKLTLYFLTVASTQVMSFLTFPLIAKNLTVGDFGHYSLLISCAGLLGGLTTAWIRNIAFRTFYDAQASGETGNFLRTYAALQVITLGAFSTLAFAISQLVGFGDLSLTSAFLVLSYVAAGDAYSLLLNTTRAQEMATAFAATENTICLLRIIGIIVLIRTDLITATGILVTYAALLAVAALSLVWLLSRNLTYRPDPRTLDVGNILRLGLSALPLSVAGWVIASSDRIIIARYLGGEQLGIYAANYTAADRVIGGLAAAIFMFMWPRILSTHNEAPEQIEGAYRQATQLYCTATVGPAVAFVFFSPVVLRLFADSRYESGSPLMPVIAVAATFSGLVTQLSRPVEVRKHYAVMSGVSICAAVTNIVLTVALVPRMGLMGAAVGTLLGYLTSALLYVFIERSRLRQLPMGFVGGLTASCLAAGWAISTWRADLMGLVVFCALYSVPALIILRRSLRVR